MVFITKNPKETEDVGYRLAKALDAMGAERAFIAMRGEMGVGKTAFVRGFATALDVSGVRSPTYTVVNEYRGKRRVYHFDMYRIESYDDLLSIGFDDYVYSDGYCIAEWSENVVDELPDDVITVSIERIQDRENERKIEIIWDYEL